MRYEGGASAANLYMAIYVVPVRPGSCRTFVGIGYPTDKPPGPLKPPGLLLRLPHWLLDPWFGLQELSDQDVVIMHSQARMVCVTFIPECCEWPWNTKHSTLACMSPGGDCMSPLYVTK